MPTVGGSDPKSPWAGVGEAFTMVADLIAGIAVWGAIGYGLDHLFGTWPVLFVIGAIVGNATGAYVVYRRSTAAVERGRPNKNDRELGERN